MNKQMISTTNSFIFNLIKSNINDFNGLNYYNNFIPKNVSKPYLFIENLSTNREGVFNKNIQTITNKIHIVNNELDFEVINTLKSSLIELLTDKNNINKTINNKYKIIEILIINQEINTVAANIKVSDFIITFKVLVEIIS